MRSIIRLGGISKAFSRGWAGGVTTLITAASPLVLLGACRPLTVRFLTGGCKLQQK